MAMTNENDNTPENMQEVFRSVDETTKALRFKLNEKTETTFVQFVRKQSSSSS